MIYVPCTLMGMVMEEAVRIGIHTVYFDEHGHGRSGEDVRVLLDQGGGVRHQRVLLVLLYRHTALT